ncbi:MAG: ATP phosphoribosyltransferase regulatory subunit [Clostridia bacterium]|nr:ATP phosphoribosyltransferase regulatory subunit [Clostridia bacterium]
MQRWNKNIPEGTRDIIFDEAQLHESIERSLAEIYRKNGFMQVMTPAIEYYDVFDGESRYIEQADMYKMSDMSGRLLVLRADNTMPIARMVATKLRSASFPQKIFYSQNVYRANSNYTGRRNETLQSGVEIIGGGLKCDLVCITTALEALKSMGVNFKIEIGHVGFFNGIIGAMNLSAEEEEMIRSFVNSKNSVSLKLMKSTPELEIIRRIPLLFGGSEVLEEAGQLAAGNDKAAEALAYVRTLYDILTESGYGDSIMIDLGIVGEMEYYTGVVFRGYMEGAGEPVLGGGRYDNLLKNFDFDMPATGFAINVSLAADALRGTQQKAKPADYLIHFTPALFPKAESFRKSLEARGIPAEYSCFEEIEGTVAFAKEAGISYVAEVDADGVKITEVTI